MALSKITNTGIGTVDNITLSGGVYLGGTGSANYLDDYEEGTWTPTVGGNATYTVQTGSYVKVGNLVFLNYDMYINTLGTGSASTMSGLPFTSKANGLISTTAISYYAGITTGFNFISGYVPSNSATLLVTGNNANATTITFNSYSIYQNGARLVGSVCYEVA